MHLRRQSCKVAFSVLKAVLATGIIIPELYAIMKRVTKMMIRTEAKGLRIQWLEAFCA